MHDSAQRETLGRNWLWFVPLCLVVLTLVERHTVVHAHWLGKLAYQRWSWGVLVSPSAYFCWCVILASVFWPLYGLLAIAAMVKTRGRYVRVVLLAVAILVFPLVTDALTWGSFPSNIDKNGVRRLRLIPFVPWPAGNYGDY